MASIKKRGDSYLVTVSMGYNHKGKKITKSKTFNKPSKMTHKKWEKEIQKLSIQYELEVQKGLHLSSNVTLEEFTERWFENYGNIQLKTKTLSICS